MNEVIHLIIKPLISITPELVLRVLRLYEAGALFGVIGFHAINQLTSLGFRSPEKSYGKGIQPVAEWVTAQFVDLQVFNMLASEWKSSFTFRD